MPNYYVPLPPVINGLKGSFKQPGCSFGRNESGFFWNYIFEGTAAEVDSDAAICALNGLQFEVTSLQGGRKRLTFKTSTPPGSGSDGESPQNVWELDSNEVPKDLLAADFPFGSLNFVSKENKAVVADWLTSGIDSKSAQLTGTPAEIASATSLYYLKRFGVEYFPVEASVIRHTQFVSNQYTVKASFFRVGRIISSSSMVSLEGTPSTLLFDVPSEPTVGQVVETAGDLQYGWRKPRPSVSRINASKWQISQVYQFGLWAVRLYGAVL